MSFMTGVPGGSADKPAVFFDGPASFRAWLQENHDTSTELWVELRRKGSQDRGLTWEQAVEESLCFGWIDSRAEGVDEIRRRQRFTPRKKTSNWSAINIALMERLQREGRMTPAGLAIFEARDRAKDAVYTYEREAAKFDPVLARLLTDHAQASAFWALATPSYRRIATSWVMTAKQPSTRESRMTSLVADCAAGLLIKSQRYGAEPSWARKAREQLGLPAR